MWHKQSVGEKSHPILASTSERHSTNLTRSIHWAQRLLYIVIHEGIVVYWGSESEIRATSYGVTVRVARTSKSKRLISQQIKPTHFYKNCFSSIPLCESSFVYSSTIPIIQGWFILRAHLQTRSAQFTKFLTSPVTSFLGVSVRILDIFLSQWILNYLKSSLFFKKS